MKVRRSTAVVLTLVPVIGLGLVGSASADAPSKSGWWNAATANGVALPMPTTGAGDLHVGQGPSAPTAFGAVAYDLAGQDVSAATLKLQVVANSTVGTIDVMACPTKDASWKGGGDQPYNTAPVYDCAAGSHGIVSKSGTAVTFLLDAGQLLNGSGYSLVIVPAAGAAPFTADFAKPGVTSLATEAAPTAAAAPSTADVVPATGGGATAPPPPAGPGPAVGAAPVAPLVPVTTPLVPAVALPAPTIASPVVPAPQAAAPPSATTPAAGQGPVAAPSNRDRYTAGTLLALLAGFLVWCFQQKSPQPRLIGGMARKAGPAAAVVFDDQPRGIGRFAAIRNGPARRLV